MATKTDNAPAPVIELSPGRKLARSLAHADGWANALSGIGMANRDKTTQNTFATSPLTVEQCEDLWRGDDMAAKAVERIPEEMLREGFVVRVKAMDAPEAVDPNADPLAPEGDPEDDTGEIVPEEGAGAEGDKPADPKAGETEPGSEELPDEPPPAGEETDKPKPGPEDRPAEGQAAPNAPADPKAGKPSDPNAPPAKPEEDPKKPKRDAFGGPPGGGAGFGAPPAPPKPPGVIKRGDGETKEIEEAVTAKLEELKAEDRFLEALQKERGLGGSAILVGADDGMKNLRVPLNLEGIRDVRFLTVLSPQELVPVEYFSNPLEPNYGEPSIWRIQPQGVPISGSTANAFATMTEVHASRLIIFGGIRVSRRQVQSQNGWGDSVLVRMHKVLSDLGMSWGGAAILLADFAQAVMKINGLAELIATDQDEVVIKRAQTVDLTRSIARMILIDGENEEFERKSTSLAGFPEMLDRFASRFAAAADMPVTLLMGEAPAGLNATGDSDIRSFYDRCAAKQRKHLRPALERLIRLVFLSAEGPTHGVEPEVWGLEFAPLYQLTAKEEADRRKVIADADAIYLDRGVVTPEEIAASRFGGDKFSAETVIDFEGREDLAVQHEEAVAEHEVQTEEAKKAAEENPPDPNAPPPNGPPGAPPPPAGKPGKPAPAPAPARGKAPPPKGKAPPFAKKDNARGAARKAPAKASPKKRRG